MKKTLKTVFLSKNLFVTCILLAICAWVVWGVLCITTASLYELSCDAVFYLALIIGLLIAYRKGETNVQKALIGALLFLLCNSNLEIMWVYFQSGDVFLIVIDALTMLLAIVIFITHLVLQSDHVGFKRAIVLNQCCGLIAVILMIYFFRQAFFMENPSVLDLTFIPAWVITYLILICMETRIQEYKRIRALARENGSWTEEARKEAKQIFKI